MKKLGATQSSERLIYSRRGGAMSAPRRAIFSAFGLDDYQDASVPRIYDYPARGPLLREPEDYPNNIVRFTTFHTSRRKA